jgi:signal transduction histidine kinase
LLDLPADQDPRLHPRNTCIHHGYTSVALVPIRGADRIVGLIHINDRRKDCFTRETIEGLENMAAHIGSALMRKRAEAERETLQAQLIQAQKMETVGTLARGMAHEMNNPIMGIMNYAQLIKDRAAGNAVFAEFADEILLEGKRVATMTHSLLSITQQQEAVPFVATAPAAMVAAALTMAAEPARERGIALSCSIPDDLPPASCRPGQIGQILAGLLTNAMEALEEAPAEDLPREKKIVVSAREVVIREPSSVITDRLSVEDSRPNTDHFLRITVEDNGPGIPNDIRERVFDPFFTTKDRTRHSGLGLWSSRSVIQEHSGNISLESEVGKWTRFSIDLPVGLKS